MPELLTSHQLENHIGTTPSPYLQGWNERQTRDTYPDGVF